MRITRRLAAALAITTLTAAQAPAADTPRDTRPDAWTAVDALNRRIVPAQYPPARAGRFVGVFYFLWMQSAPGAPLLDMTKIVSENPTTPAWGPKGAFHFWGHPYFGYYRSDDPWVIARHAQMLSDAGVDVIVFDVTNAVTYDPTFLKICEVYTDLRKQGRRTPQIAFITHSKSAKTTMHLYDTFYSKSLYSDLWFRWKGKPLLMGPGTDLPPEIENFFSRRDSWAWTTPEGWFKDGRLKWPWLDDSPQRAGWAESPDKPEEISVSVAGHPTRQVGRSHHDGQQPPENESRPEQGLFFAEQWKRALQVDPEFVFVTGWNEWIAQRFVATDKGPKFCGYRTLKAGDTFFVDNYSQEFSRDIEPMNGGYGDNYYYQLADGIRRYKGVRPAPAAGAAKTIDIAGSFAQWQDVVPEYLDDTGDTAPRDHAGFADAGRLTNTSGRNDLLASQVTADREQVYFHVRTVAPLTRPSPSDWMTLLVSTDSATANWCGFDLAINRTAPANGQTDVERWDGHGWKRVGRATVRFDGTDLHLAVPRSLLARSGVARFAFKWTDNVPVGGAPLGLIDQGDTAPNGRFAYVYRR